MSETRIGIPDYPFANPAPLVPPEEWAELRRTCPISRVRLPSGDEAVLLTRYRDVKQLLLDPRFTRTLTAEDAARINAEGTLFSMRDAEITGPFHAEWRRLVGRAFTAKRVAELRPRLEAMAGHLIDEMVRQGPPADLCAKLAFPLPVWAICALLGVPDADRDRFRYWSDTMLSLTRYSRAEIDAAQDEFTAYMSALIAAKRAAPGDDLISDLLEIVGTLDTGLTERVLLLTAQGLLVAGHETTTNMIGKMVAMLLADRRRWEALLADPSLVRTAVEESLRFDANPGFGLPRYLGEDVEVGGVTLPAGTTVICSMGAANRDEEEFDRADEMVLDRAPNAHIAFGVGPYSCLGQALARAELRSVLRELLRRLPTLELAVPVEELTYRQGLIVGGLERLPVRW
ncbi:cytochrome P450 [Thermopolyspora flexuosa]|uniref:Cytochrome P450 n=1 Tax=Thermopolyspora flexuosa TaxID=103836 RepID=A0A543J468_9ACTN|nr:cytochrome P450 [Thermopolyspora flexuosa]TQM77617.1 cytochrome P450 [Thermopolyspora flexuosa]GGM72046.1 cytochrome P450 [Thermopolyspora flexuosa]